MSIRSGGRLLTNSLNKRAGTVIAPSSSTLAPIQQLIPISRFVAARRNWLSFASNKILPNTGIVLREETARLTTDRPLARFSCRQLTRTGTSLFMAAKIRLLAV